MDEARLSEQLLIDGERVSAVSVKMRTIINPATNEPLATVAEGDCEDVDAAVQSSHRAFYEGPWRRLNSRERTRLLLDLAELIRKQIDALARLESQNVGKPIREARDEVALAADCFEYYAGAINKTGGQTIPVAAPGIGMTFREPIGVCGLIVPWNFPIAITSWKIAPALAMGNTVVVKPASQTPLTAFRIGELALEADFPPGVLNVISGPGSVVGEALVRQLRCPGYWHDFSRTDRCLWFNCAMEFPHSNYLVEDSTSFSYGQYSCGQACQPDTTYSFPDW